MESRVKRLSLDEVGNLVRSNGLESMKPPESQLDSVERLELLSVLMGKASDLNNEGIEVVIRYVDDLLETKNFNRR